jgi:ABC-type iron transport system FetAB permease component
MNTTYDNIMECFLQNAKPDMRNISSTSEGLYLMIHAAMMHYNSLMEEEDITYDDTTETLNIKLDDSRLLVLGYCMKYIYDCNRLSEFLDIYSIFQKDMGFKDYNAQLKGKENAIDRTEQKITELITNCQDNSLMGDGE